MIHLHHLYGVFYDDNLHIFYVHIFQMAFYCILKIEIGLPSVKQMKTLSVSSTGSPINFLVSVVFICLT